MIFGANDIVILLGAGASKDAGLPTSLDMVRDVEHCLKTIDHWKSHAELYNCVKSGIFYADGVKGKFDRHKSYNIERLVNTLRELEKNEDHVIYPFVASWNMKLVEVTKGKFDNLKALRSKIIERLFNNWIRLEVNETAAYYRGITEFQKSWGYPLRVFTLNYDLCVETACADARIERGFGADRLWDWRRFEDDEHTEAQIYLYKMHGSIDWKRNRSGTLTHDDTPRIPDNLEDLELIFGTDYMGVIVRTYTKSTKSG